MRAPDSLNPPKITRRQVVGIILGLAFCVALLAGLIHFIKTDIAEKRELLLKNPGYATGVITRVRRYKGRRVSVRYTVGGVEYSFRTRVPRMFLRTHAKGDTTAVIYAKSDPANATLKARLRPSTN
ncbi:DUF3592 domain-containing protein [Hymenobacter terrestris]|uniref:DUF3592 domain-containing protein n=1 Tax=Hymenobacter terrestris TaxID=2748310 RepID=A0ABX2Q5X7_9BACT|nr:hypothetical protein [Hymenobacter terrestris]NVO85826.1 hypothetical protein [Hymenobacter terrestris]